MAHLSVHDGGTKLQIRCKPTDARVVHEMLAARVRLRVATARRWWQLSATVTATGPADVVEVARQEVDRWLDDRWLEAQW